jgi:1-acyl-sn-glycerol-3-phosphate acyltransferase
VGILRWLFFALVVRPLVIAVLGLKLRHRERLPRDGPAFVVANHNSHFDTLVLMTLFPLRLLPKLHPVAAEDFFGRNRALAWFTERIIGGILFDRSGKHRDPFVPVEAAIASGAIVFFFPEGTRGEPERMAPFKRGIAHLASRHPDVPVTPIFLHGLGKALPKNAWLPVPFIVDVLVGPPLRYGGDREGFMAALNGAMDALVAEGGFPPWT